MNTSSKSNSETHPLFPSGEWEGFYTYPWSAQRHMKVFFLDFQSGTVTGSGIDDVAPFQWRGVYDTKELRCKMTKYYHSHTVDYDGYVDENGIWGSWTMGGFSKGGFHFWPKPQAEKTAEAEIEAEKIAVPRTVHVF
jgi:hypothetical protein